MDAMHIGVWQVWEHISPRVDGEVKEWLRSATAPLVVKDVVNA